MWTFAMGGQYVPENFTEATSISRLREYGAKPDERGPIGGGAGHVGGVAGGDYTARDLDALLDSLSKAGTTDRKASRSTAMR